MSQANKTGKKSKKDKRLDLQLRFLSSEEKAQCLQEKFLARSKELSSNNIEVKSETQVKVVKEGKSSSIDSKKLINAQEKLRESKASIVKLRKQNNVLSTDFAEVSKELTSTKKELATVKSESTDLNTRLVLAEKEIARLKLDKARNKKIVSGLRTKLDNKHKAVVHLEDKLGQYKARIRKLLFGEKSDLDVELKSLRAYYSQIIANYEVKLKKQESKYNSKISMYIAKLKKLSEKSRNSHIEDTTVSEEVVVTPLYKELLGTLSVLGTKLTFTSTTEDSFDVCPLNDGTPCAVRLVAEDKVVISRLFSTRVKSSQRGTTSVKQIKATKSKVTQKFDIPYKVLIIGASHKDEYLSVLNKSGLDVSWFNSFEGNVVRLKGMLDRFDIVLCCYKHTKHYASHLMKYMQENDETNAVKYNIVLNDTVDSLLGRVNYVLENSVVLNQIKA